MDFSRAYFPLMLPFLLGMIFTDALLYAGLTSAYPASNTLFHSHLAGAGLVDLK